MARRHHGRDRRSAGQDARLAGPSGPSGDADGPLSLDDAEAYVASTCFKTGPPGTVGVELEWFVHDRHAPRSPVPPSRLPAALGDQLAGRVTTPIKGRLTCEPGGQLELSSQPAPTLARCLDETAADLAELRTRLEADGLALRGSGLDPFRPPVRVLQLPRYAAMERFFDRFGPDGRVMMCSTASVQVCLDAGVEGDDPARGFRSRWRLVHALGPVLVAAFANSPLRHGRPTGWRSSRQAVWSCLDPGRARSVFGQAVCGSPVVGSRDGAARVGADPRLAWARYALEAQVLCIRAAEGPWSTPDGLTFGDWVRGGGPRRPTRADLAYHLTTLFPPVRPRGWVELRMIDAQPDDDWVVPAAVAYALVEDSDALAAAQEACDRLWSAGPDDPWLRAARDGLTDPRLAAAALVCFDAALSALPRLGASERTRQAVEQFCERYVVRGRTPADDRLAEWRRGHLTTDKEPLPC